MSELVVKNVRDESGVMVFTLTNYPGTEGIPLLTKTKGQIDLNYEYFIFNLSEIVHIDSYGLDCLKNVSKKISNEGCQLVLVGLQKKVTNIFIANHLITLFTINTNIKVALRYFQSQIQQQIKVMNEKEI
jgi:anti-anti-sigma factor